MLDDEVLQFLDGNKALLVDSKVQTNNEHLCWKDSAQLHSQQASMLYRHTGADKCIQQLSDLGSIDQLWCTVKNVNLYFWYEWEFNKNWSGLGISIYSV